MKERKRDFASLKKLIERHKKYAFILLVVMLLAALFEGFGLSLVLPVLSRLMGVDSLPPDFAKYIDMFLYPFPASYRFEILLSALAVAFLFKSILMLLHKGMAVNFAMRLREEWSEQIFFSYLNSGYKDILSQRQGTLINNITLEPLRAAKSITMLLEMLSKLILAIVLSSMLLLTNWKITLLAGCGGGGLFYVLRNITHRYSIRFGKERLELNQLISAIAAEGVGAIREIKVFGVGEKVLSSMVEKMTRFTKIHTKFTVLSDMPRHFVEFIIVLLITLVLIFIRLFGRIELREVFPLVGFFVLVFQRLLVYVTFVISYRMKISSFFPSLNLIHTLIYEDRDQEELPQGLEFNKLEHYVSLRDISFSYADSRAIFENLSLTIEKGKITALVGPSGIGKSTIADLILRLLVPQGGEILVDGEEISQYDLVSWRGKVGYVAQEPYIFNTSIKNNILIGNPSANDDDIVKAAELANIHDLIATLPDGYDTIVGDRGARLSVGQKQRLAIARTIIRQPELFIFDEATSALDGQSEKMIRQCIEKLSRSKTIFIIAHRISTLEKADIIYELGNDGEIRIADYDALMSSN